MDLTGPGTVLLFFIVFLISTFRNIDISKNKNQPNFLVPLHSGNPLQLQNSLPALTPFFATRFIIGLPHFGQVGASLWMLCSVLNASLSAVKASVKPPSFLKFSSKISRCFPSIMMRRLQSTMRQFASMNESLERNHSSNLCFCFKICKLLSYCTSSLYVGLSSWMLVTFLCSLDLTDQGAFS